MVLFDPQNRCSNMISLLSSSKTQRKRNALLSSSFSFRTSLIITIVQLVFQSHTLIHLENTVRSSSITRTTRLFVVSSNKRREREEKMSLYTGGFLTEDFGYVLIIVVLATFQHIAFGFRVGFARRRFGVQPPTMYAVAGQRSAASDGLLELSEEQADEFNRIQRIHQVIAFSSHLISSHLFSALSESDLDVVSSARLNSILLSSTSCRLRPHFLNRISKQIQNKTEQLRSVAHVLHLGGFGWLW